VHTNCWLVRVLVIGTCQSLQITSVQAIDSCAAAAAAGERPEWMLRDVMKPANRTFKSKLRNYTQWELRVKQRRAQQKAAAAAVAQQAAQQAEAAAIKAAILAAEESNQGDSSSSSVGQELGP
jgi:hypothetical protein